MRRRDQKSTAIETSGPVVPVVDGCILTDDSVGQTRFQSLYGRTRHANFNLNLRPLRYGFDQVFDP